MMEKRRSNTIIWMNDKRHPPRKKHSRFLSKTTPTTTIASHSTATKKAIYQVRAPKRMKTVCEQYS